jgi:hypothetical protein
VYTSGPKARSSKQGRDCGLASFTPKPPLEQAPTPPLLLLPRRRATATTRDASAVNREQTEDTGFAIFVGAIITAASVILCGCVGTFVACYCGGLRKQQQKQHEQQPLVIIEQGIQHGDLGSTPQISVPNTFLNIMTRGLRPTQPGATSMFKLPSRPSATSSAVRAQIINRL